jgi:predicted acylesterase/phospholipase RssA
MEALGGKLAWPDFAEASRAESKKSGGESSLDQRQRVELFYSSRLRAFEMTELSEPIPIQVVFQGGGAKLCALMAVCSLLEEYEGKGIIKVNRVAGSSAGAIAAVMCASLVTIDEYKTRLKSVAPVYIRKMDISKIPGYSRVALFGTPYFNTFRLEDFFRDLFCSKPDAPKTLNKLRMDAEVYATNIYSLAAHPAPANEAIPIALANSCRIPYVFSGYKSDNHQVDGGLALNLPVDHLKNEQSSLGTVIGISFLSTFGSASFGNVLNYTGQLFSAAIQSNVDRSKMLLGEENVFSIPTSIGTFDFADALNEGLGEKFELVRLQFKSWFDNRLLGLRPPSIGGIPRPSPFVYPILTNTPWTGAVIEELKDRFRAEKFTHALSMSSFDTAILDDKGGFTGKYKSRFRNRYRILKKTHILAYDFQAGKSGATFSDLKLRVMVINEKAEPLKFATHVQELPSDDSDLRSFRIFLLFEAALLPESADQPFTVECDYEVDDPFPKLGSDAEILTFTRADGDADEVTVAAAFPTELLRKNHVFADIAAVDAQRRTAAGFAIDTQLTPSEELSVGEFITELALTSETRHYIFQVRRAKNVAQGQTIGFLVE